MSSNSDQNIPYGWIAGAVIGVVGAVAGYLLTREPENATSYSSGANACSPLMPNFKCSKCSKNIAAADLHCFYCGHNFHKSCLVKNTKKCPICPTRPKPSAPDASISTAPPSENIPNSTSSTPNAATSEPSASPKTLTQRSTPSTSKNISTEPDEKGETSSGANACTPSSGNKCSKCSEDIAIADLHCFFCEHTFHESCLVKNTKKCPICSTPPEPSAPDASISTAPPSENILNSTSSTPNAATSEPSASPTTLTQRSTPSTSKNISTEPKATVKKCDKCNKDIETTDFRTFDCNHIYHTECYEDWSKNADKCLRCIANNILKNM